MKRRGLQAGASAVEFALIVVTLLVVLFGIMDWSWYMYHWLSVTTAAGRGARIAAGIPLSKDPVGRAQTEAGHWLTLYGLRVDPTINVQILTRDYSKVLQVEVQVPFEPLVGLVPVPAELRGTAEVLWYGEKEGD